MDIVGSIVLISVGPKNNPSKGSLSVQGGWKQLVFTNFGSCVHIYRLKMVNKFAAKTGIVAL